MSYGILSKNAFVLGGYVLGDVALGDSVLDSSKTVKIQTETHPDIPYKVTDALPPIFSKGLKKKTPVFRFLSRSIPDLQTICWSEYDIRDLDLWDSDEQYDDESNYEVVYTDADVISGT